ncbi:hypothetical protein [Nonomuraea rhizosphaerae]|uniref:hypothetical protein n=1 Tax=Nonomuraea rhizosphaerae TaxID=2665663 RepID=UPI001C600B70|nr:hypothetical protein [Nonomuraea rhizosphaerae]
MHEFAAALTTGGAGEIRIDGDARDLAAVLEGPAIGGFSVGRVPDRPADADRDGLISVDEVQAVGAEQTPQRWLYGGAGEIILARARERAPGTCSPRHRRPGPRQLHRRLQPPRRVPPGRNQIMRASIVSTTPSAVLPADGVRAGDHDAVHGIQNARVVERQSHHDHDSAVSTTCLIE